MGAAHTSRPPIPYSVVAETQRLFSDSQCTVGRARSPSRSPKSTHDFLICGWGAVVRRSRSGPERRFKIEGSNPRTPRRLSDHRELERVGEVRTRAEGGGSLCPWCARWILNATCGEKVGQISNMLNGPRVNIIMECKFSEFSFCNLLWVKMCEMLRLECGLLNGIRFFGNLLVWKWIFCQYLKNVM